VRELLRGAPLKALTKTSRGSVVLAILLWPGLGLLAFWLKRRWLGLGLWLATGDHLQPQHVGQQAWFSCRQPGLCAGPAAPAPAGARPAGGGGRPDAARR
jgi:hypothetical protein